MNRKGVLLHGLVLARHEDLDLKFLGYFILVYNDLKLFQIDKWLHLSVRRDIKLNDKLLGEVAELRRAPTPSVRVTYVELTHWELRILSGAIDNSEGQLAQFR